MAIRPSSQADFLTLWRAVLPADYTEGIESEAEGAGFDVPSLQAAIFADFEANLNVSQQAYFLRQHSIQTGARATSGAKARTTLQLYRAAPVLGDLVVNVGQLFLATATDSLGTELALGRFLAVLSVTLPAGSGGPIAVEVEAEFEGYTGNVWEGVITTFEAQGRLSVPSIVTATNEVRRSVASNSLADRFNLGLLGRMIRLVPVGALVTPDASAPRRVVGAYIVSGETALQFDPPLDPADVLEPVQVELEEMADLGVTVTQPNPAIGGCVDTLRAVGAERKIERLQNETDGAFADRLVELPDTVSPNAIERILKRTLTPFGIAWCLHETGEVDELMGFTWDLHPWDIGEPCACSAVEALGSELVGSGIVWMSEGTATRFFIVCVTLTNVDDVGGGWDSDGPADFPWAWGELVWDGIDAVFSSALGQAYDAINAAREAGVGFTIVLDESP